VIFIINCVAQFLLLNSFLGMDFGAYGIEVLSALFQGGDWRGSDRFPRVTMCDFQIRRLGQLQTYTVQCVLPINLFNEMIYLFIWFWMVLVIILTVYSLITWSMRSMMSQDRARFIKKHLMLLNKVNKDDKESKQSAIDFTEKYLRQDGVFILRLIGYNTNDITATELICALFDIYCEKKQNSRE